MNNAIECRESCLVWEYHWKENLCRATVYLAQCRGGGNGAARGACYLVFVSYQFVAAIVPWRVFLSSESTYFLVVSSEMIFSYKDVAPEPAFPEKDDI